jgi:SHS2 domain-containing protein
LTKKEVQKKFEFLEHMADAYIAAYGKTIEKAFENAAMAMFDVMTEIEKINPKVKEKVEVKGEDEEALLYNWLEDLLIRFEIKNRVYSNFKVTSLIKTFKGFKLKAEIFGEEFQEDRHTQKVGVKAITYHLMEIKRKPNKITLKFILDL